MALTLRPPRPADAAGIAAAITEAVVAAWSGFLGEERIRAAKAHRDHPADLVAEDAQEAGRPAWRVTEERNARALRFYEREGWRPDGEVREREWHGAPLREPRLVRDLG